MKKPSWELTNEESKELQKHFKDIPIKDMITCPNCYGSGKITDQYGIWHIFWMPTSVTCKTCGGSGKVTTK